MTDNTATPHHPVRRVARIAAKVLGVAFILLLAFIGLLTLVRDAPNAQVLAFGDREGPPAVGDPEFTRSIELFTGARMEPGNTVDLLVSGAGTYPVLWQSMRSAQRSLTVQLYYILPGRLADTLVTVLSERARAGVPTYLLRDAIGSELPDSTLQQLKSAGVHVKTFRPVKWWTLHKAQNRSHVRAVVIDGVTGFTGGFGIDDRWDGNGRQHEQWRDTNVRVSGPAVRQLQSAFARAWSEATGELLVGEAYFPVAGAPIAGGTSVTAGIMHSVPTFGPTANALLFALSVAGARRTLFISNAYFVPNSSMREQLKAAAARGVDVRLLLPGEETDVPMTRHAARSYYADLIAGGVKIYEYQPSMQHAKTFVVDGSFSGIGTTNMDYRSLALNDELNLMVMDASFGARMDSLYAEDLKYSKLIDAASFRKRSAWEKIQERFARGIGKAL